MDVCRNSFCYCGIHCYGGRATVTQPRSADTSPEEEPQWMVGGGTPGMFGKKPPEKTLFKLTCCEKSVFLSKYHIAFRMIKNGLRESHCKLVISDRKFNYILYVLRHYYAQIMMITRPLDSL